MKINNGISLGNIWTIAITFLALDVLWGSGQTKIQNVENDIEKLEVSKADKDVIEVKIDYMSSQIDEIKEMLKEIK